VTFPNVVFIRHKVMNFRKWKAVFEAHSAARLALGCQGAHIFRRADNPKELVVMLTWSDLAKARQFLVSEDLRAMLAEVPVSDRAPDVFLLEEVEETFLSTLRDPAAAANGAPSKATSESIPAPARSIAFDSADEAGGRPSFASPAWFR
jgi:quinol monooxygenase YgiN